MEDLNSFHPGALLKKLFLEPLALTPYRLAKDIGVPQTRISQILSGRRAITADTALRLAKYFGLEESFWLEAQTAYDLAREKQRIGQVLEHIQPFEPGTHSGGDGRSEKRRQSRTGPIKTSVGAPKTGTKS